MAFVFSRVNKDEGASNNNTGGTTMKPQRLFAALALLLVPLLAAGQVSHSVSFPLSDLVFEKKDGFDFVRMKGLSFLEEIGGPMLPVKELNLIIPTGMDVASITIDQTSVQVIPGITRIYPAQPRIPTSANQQQKGFIPPNPTVYGSDTPYPV
jgi:hypothetical protein